MSAFGHTITSATQRDRDFYNKPSGQWPPCGCTWPKCGKPEVVYVTSYRYVTGRRGRVSSAEKFVCEAHGRKFAAKYKLEAPDPAIPGTQKSASQSRSEFVSAALGSIQGDKA